MVVRGRLRPTRAALLPRAQQEHRGHAEVPDGEWQGQADDQAAQGVLQREPGAPREPTRQRAEHGHERAQRAGGHVIRGVEARVVRRAAVPVVVVRAAVVRGASGAAGIDMGYGGEGTDVSTRRR